MPLIRRMKNGMLTRSSLRELRWRYGSSHPRIHRPQGRARHPGRLASWQNAASRPIVGAYERALVKHALSIVPISWPLR